MLFQVELEAVGQALNQPESVLMDKAKIADRERCAEVLTRQVLLSEGERERGLPSG